ncbi:MAG: glycosyltransferase family 39 protein [Acidobacteriia bacterium]|nr:glycosyltransferase family 39 protein [Terriglobia bacterium]
MPEPRTGNDIGDSKASNDQPRLRAAPPSPGKILFVGHWSSSCSYALLAGLTIACLLPFSGRAFHVDDTLFVMAARQIVRHPLDPYGFSLVWNTSLEQMVDVTKNPPLACYYGALVGRLAGWSERAFHIAFLLPALALVLGTYRLAKHFTRFPLLAASATVLTPGILVSACSVMCDTMMLALWVWAVILWIEGLQPQKARYLAGSAVLIAASALTKYFGTSLILLLAAYSFVRLRRVGSWIWYLLIPVGALVGYEFWTQALIGRGLLSSAADFATAQRAFGQASRLATALVALSFTGGCTLSVLTFCPLLWSRRAAGLVAVGSALAASALILGWVDSGLRVGGELAPQALRAQWALVGTQLGLFIAGGLFTLALAITDYWNRRSPDSLLLGLWVMGTFAFVSVLNWTVNARSVIPLIPAAAILAARRLESRHDAWTRNLILQVAGALTVSGVLSIWLAGADTRLANLAREAAQRVHWQTSNQVETLWYEGHWGFQYYMEQFGAVPVDAQDFQIRPGDRVVLPNNNTEMAGLPQDMFFQQEAFLEFANPSLATTISWHLGAGFYSSYWGPLPFTFGPVPSEQYVLVRAIPSP